MKTREREGRGEEERESQDIQNFLTKLILVVVVVVGLREGKKRYFRLV